MSHWDSKVVYHWDMLLNVVVVGRELKLCGCEVCSHAWLSSDEPRRCAKCKSARWNTKPSGFEAGVPMGQLAGGESVPMGQNERDNVPMGQRRRKKNVPMGHESKAKLDAVSTVKADGGTGKVSLETNASARPDRTYEKPTAHNLPGMSAKGSKSGSSAPGFGKWKGAGLCRHGLVYHPGCNA